MNPLYIVFLIIVFIAGIISAIIHSITDDGSAASWSGHILGVAAGSFTAGVIFLVIVMIVTSCT